MITKYYDNVINLSNNAWIGRKNSRYDFGYKDNIIVARCQNFSYISGKIVCLKKDNTIIVFSMNIIKTHGIKTVEKLLEFTAYSKVAYGKIICERNTYLIDSNCQIKFNEKNHIN